MTRSSRISRARIVEQLRLAARKGDRVALALAIDQMKTLAFSPRYWERYLDLVQHPMARLVDLLVIKRGDAIARQKGWTRPRRARRAPVPAPAPAARQPRKPRRRSAVQESLFPDLPA